MSSKLDPTTPALPAQAGPRRGANASALLLTAACVVAGLAGCASRTPAPAAVAVVKPATAVPAPVAAPEPKPVELPNMPARSLQKPGEQTLRMLAYAERIRMLPPAELGQEIARLTDLRQPAEQFQLAMALGQLRQLPELIRAQELLARVLGNAEAEALHPLARLLASRYIEQRRVEEQLDRQNQQTRDIQRRLDQTTERLEALKAIERSLSNRQPPSTPSPPASAAPQPGAANTPTAPPPRTRPAP